jgi:hypothetical protein
MRMNRILTGLLGLALAGAAPVITTSAADAATPHVGAHAARATAPETSAREKLPKREITARVVKKSARVLVFKGKVKSDPAYSHKIVKIQRKIGKHGHWKPYAKDRTTNKGNWAHRVGAPRNGKWFFRAWTPKTDHYGRSFSEVWFTYSY